MASQLNPSLNHRQNIRSRTSKVIVSTVVGIALAFMSACGGINHDRMNRMADVFADNDGTSENQAKCTARIFEESEMPEWVKDGIATDDPNGFERLKDDREASEGYLRVVKASQKEC